MTAREIVKGEQLQKVLDKMKLYDRNIDSMVPTIEKEFPNKKILVMTGERGLHKLLSSSIVVVHNPQFDNTLLDISRDLSYYIQVFVDTKHVATYIPLVELERSNEKTQILEKT